MLLAAIGYPAVLIHTIIMSISLTDAFTSVADLPHFSNRIEKLLDKVAISIESRPNSPYNFGSISRNINNLWML
ncbi:protein of unknown function [Vibrio tapetis subsp. tapetis]|uniref:Uncharacterized protein n=1 Tax=Vibrio tapetis subsp. tapetis TaxID=1671868 RepID=A0A2N8ZMX2_9VIBR|nr:protein of unknown function [Vibrio tapetis subsp. tapetis]